ncbi:MAG: hypothetical protein ACLQNE_02615 [Thermoguttaceae bacterium]|jgi:hypothetical protein
MSQRTLEDRLTTLEQTVKGLVDAARTGKQGKDWLSTIGMFEGDPVIGEIQEEGRKIREADRRAVGPDSKS